MKLGLLLTAAYVKGIWAACDFKVVKPWTLGDPDTSPIWQDAFIVHDAFDLTPEYADIEFLKNIFADVSFRLIERQFMNRTAISDGAPSPDFRMTLTDWLNAISDPDSQIPRYIFDWCVDNCTRVLGNFPAPPSFLFRQNHTPKFFTAIGQPGLGLEAHAHGETWVMQLVGSKTWKAGPRGKFNTSEMMECEQKPGDLVYLPALWEHATTQQTWSVSFGSQARTPPGGCVNTGLQWQTALSNVSHLEEKMPLMSDATKEQITKEAAIHGHAQVLDLMLCDRFEDCSKRHIDTVSTLISGGAGNALSWILPRVPQTQLQKLLHKHPVNEDVITAIRSNKMEAVRLLLDARAPIRSEELQEAVFAGHEGMLELFLSKGLTRKVHVDVMTALRKQPSGQRLQRLLPYLHHNLTQTLKKSLKKAGKVATV